MSEANRKWDELFFRQVYEIASMSKDPRTKIGAVLVREKVPIMQGFNGIPQRVEDKPERYERPAKYKWIAHAEANVIHFCAKFGVPSKGAILYTQGMPCDRCMVSLIQGNIAEIILHKQWMDYEKLYFKQWSESCEVAQTMAQEAGIKIRIYDGVVDRVGVMDGKMLDL